MEEVGEDWDNCCPLCMEEMDSTDRQLKPCRCGYQICVWCWHHIMEMAEKDSSEGRCPACRTAYDKEKIVSTAVSCDRIVDISEKKQRTGKSKIKAAEGRKNLSNVRVIQRNLVYVVGIPAPLADEETLERKEYFGQYGKIFKISVSKTSSQHSAAGSSVSVYVTYVKEEDALRCIQAVNGYALEGKMLKACFGTTKYCNAWLKHMPCNNPDCLYLHDEGTREDSFTKEEMLAKYGSKNQHFHDLTHPPQRRSGIGLPPPVDVPSFSSSATNAPQNVSQNILPPMVGSASKGSPLIGNLPKSSSLPAAASWASRSSTSSSRPVSGRSGVVPVTSKPKAGGGLVNLATVSGSNTNGQSSNNHDGVKQSKSNHFEGGVACLAAPLVLLGRTNLAMDSSVTIQTEPFVTDADHACADVDVPRQGFDALLSHDRNASNADANNHTTGIADETKSVIRPSFAKGADAEESVDNLTSQSSSRRSHLQDTWEKVPIDTLQPSSVKNSFLDEHEHRRPREMDMLHGSLSMSNLDLSTFQDGYTDSKTAVSEPKPGLQQGPMETTELHSRLETHFLSEKGHTHANVIDVLGQGPSNLNDFSDFPSSDHAVGSTSSYPVPNFETMQCNIPANDPWSMSMHSVNTDDTALYPKDEVTLPSKFSSHPEQRAWTGETHTDVTAKKEPINGLSEHELISDLFSSDFDLWTDGNTQDLAQYLFTGKKVRTPSTTVLKERASLLKPSTGSQQSRFHFARQDELAEGMILQASGNERHLWMEKHTRTSSGTASNNLGDVLSGEQYSSGSTPSQLSNSKSSMMAPPGFSSRAAAVPPPGFSQHKRLESRKLAEVCHEPARSSAPSMMYNHLDSAANSSADVELIDPAIMAVGRGKLPTGPRPAISFTSSPLSAFPSQAASLSQQPRPLDFEPIFQAHHDRPFRNYGSMNSVSHLGYSNQELENASSSLFHSSFNDAINQPRLMGQYHNNVIPHVVMQDSVYGNGGHGASKLRFQHSSWDDWSRHSEGNAAGQQSVNDTAGRLAMSQLSRRLEELALNKDLGSKYFAEAAIPSGHDDQGPLNSTRIGRYYLQH